MVIQTLYFSLATKICLKISKTMMIIPLLYLLSNCQRKKKEIYDWNLEVNGHWDSEIENENDIVMDEIERYDTPFRHANTFRQLCKQAISLSLCKQNRMHNNPQYYKNQPASFLLCAMTKDLYEIVLSVNISHDRSVVGHKP